MRPNTMRFGIAAVVLGFSSSSAFSIDFRIDIPTQPDPLLEAEWDPLPPALDSTEIMTQESDLQFNENPSRQNSKNRQQNQRTQENSAFDIPPPPPLLFSAPEPEVVRNKKSNEQKNSSASTNRSDFLIGVVPDANGFETPACLQENVEFWHRIYTKVETSEAVFHDREKPGRIFGVVRLSDNEEERKLTLQTFRQYFEKNLDELASNIHTPKKWSQPVAETAALFPGRQLTRENVLRAKQNIRAQRGLKAQFEAGIQRSLTYIPTIRPILEKENIPLDIIYLPHVESSYQPRVRSKVGAVGLWQIMPGTMRDLKGAKAVNRRTEVEISTKAAAKLLNINYKATGSWPLALTAYNHGLNGIRRAVRSTGSKDLCEIIARYESPTFRFASSNFYAQFLAARQAAKGRYLELSEGQNHARILKPLLATSGKVKNELP